jgi:alcohol dehydrogenase class IV
VENHLLSTLPSPTSRVLIVTGNSIAIKTPLLQKVESLLGKQHAGTCSNIKEHGRVEQVDQALVSIVSDLTVDTILSIGGGSPIDSAKTISFRIHEKRKQFLTHITIPTTLSAAECTAGGGFTGADGVKVGFMSPGMGVTSIFYDPYFAKYTPTKLWLATGIRAVDHAVETFYQPYATEMPWKILANWALTVLFEDLPKCKDSIPHEDIITRLLLAAFASSGFRGGNFRGGMGLSHSLGHALGSPYSISRKSVIILARELLM